MSRALPLEWATSTTHTTAGAYMFFGRIATATVYAKGVQRMDGNDPLAALRALVYSREKTAAQPVADSPDSLEPDVSTSGGPDDVHDSED